MTETVQVELMLERSRLVHVSVVAGLAITLFVSAIEFSTPEPFQPRLFPVQADGYITMSVTHDSNLEAERKNVAFAWAVLGGAIAMGAAILGGAAARDTKRGFVVGMFAQAGGSVAGAVTGLILMSIWQRALSTGTPNWILPLAIHTLINLLLSGVGGVAFVVACGWYTKLWEIVGGAILGALLATAFYEIIVAMLPPSSGGSLPVARWSSTRLLAAVLPSAMITLGAAWGATSRPPAE